MPKAVQRYIILDNDIDISPKRQTPFRMLNKRIAKGIYSIIIHMDIIHANTFSPIQSFG